jgi:hypothetical protein
MLEEYHAIRWNRKLSAFQTLWPLAPLPPLILHGVVLYDEGARVCFGFPRVWEGGVLHPTH